MPACTYYRRLIAFLSSYDCDRSRLDDIFTGGLEHMLKQVGMDPILIRAYVDMGRHPCFEAIHKKSEDLRLVVEEKAKEVEVEPFPPVESSQGGDGDVDSVGEEVEGMRPFSPGRGVGGQGRGRGRGGGRGREGLCVIRRGSGQGGE